MKVRVLQEKVHDASSEIQTEQVVYFPGNGAVVRQHKNAKGEVLKGEILVRLVYADHKMTEVLLDAITRHITGH